MMASIFRMIVLTLAPLSVPGFSVFSPAHIRGFGDSSTFLRLKSTVDDSVSSSSPSSPLLTWQERAANVFSGSDTRPVILFDGVCNLCNGGVNFALDWDPDGSFRFAALQSETGKALLQRAGRRPEDISSIVLVEKDRAFIKSDAVLRIAQKLSDPFPFLGIAGQAFPLIGRNVIYDWVARNRYNFFGSVSSCRLSDVRFESRFLSD